MNWSGKLFLSLAFVSCVSSLMIACGRKSSDDVRLATKGNVAIEGPSVVSNSTLEGLAYSIRVYRIYRYNNGYATGYGNGSASGYVNGMQGYMPSSGCAPANGGNNYQVGTYGIFAEVLVNGTCLTFAMSTPGSITSNGVLGLEMTFNCEASNNCDTVYLNIVGRNPAKYSANTVGNNVTALPGGVLGYGYTNTGVWTMQADTEVKQLGIMKSISQDRVMSAIETQTVYNQRLRIETMTTELQRTASEFSGQ